MGPRQTMLSRAAAGLPQPSLKQRKVAGEDTGAGEGRLGAAAGRGSTAGAGAVQPQDMHRGLRPDRWPRHPRAGQCVTWTPWSDWQVGQRNSPAGAAIGAGALEGSLAAVSQGQRVTAPPYRPRLTMTHTCALSGKGLQSSLT